MFQIELKFGIETWNDFYDESEESFEDIAEDLIDFDFNGGISRVSSY